MRELQVYNGAVPQAAQQKFVQVQSAPKVEGHGEAVDRAIGQAVDAANKVIDLHDFSEGQKTELGRRQIANEASDALKAKLALPYDDDESLYLPDGRLDENKLNAFVNEWQQKYIGVKADFWRSENAMKDAYRQQDDAARLDRSIRTAVVGRELQNRKQYFQDNVELAMLKKDWPGAERAYNDALAGGMMTKTEHRIALLKLGQREEKERLAKLKEAGKAADGRVITGEMMQSLRSIHAPEPAGDVSGVVSSSGIQEDTGSVVFSSSKEQEEMTMQKKGLASLPSDELMAGFNMAQRLADSASVTMNQWDGMLEFQLPPSPGESTQKVAGVAQAFNGYSLADYRNSITKVAAGYFSDERMSGMSNEKLVNALADEVKMDGAADAWFNGDALAYKGWLETELSRMLIARGSGAVNAADRLMSGAEGRSGLNALLAQEVTGEEIASLNYGFNAISRVAKAGIRNEKDELTADFRTALGEYERYSERWKQYLKAEGKEYTPSDDDTPAKRFKDDWKEFSKWYMEQADLFSNRVKALEEGVRDVYRQRAIDAVATLRATGSIQLGSEVVQLDGKSDWAKEEKAMRYVLRQPISEQEMGTAKALAATKEKLYRERKALAATYAKSAAEHNELLKGKKKSIAEDKARAKQEKENAEELDKVLKQADDERLAGYGRKVERKVTYGSVSHKAGEPEPAVVVIPRKMYAEAAASLDAGDGGFYAFIPGVDDGIPVMAGDVDTVQFNAPVLNLMDGKKDKLTGQQLRAMANEGLMVPVQFGAYQKF